MNSFGIYAYSYADQNEQSAKAFSYLTNWIVSLNEITENIYGIYAYAYAEDAYWSPYEYGLRSRINNWIIHRNNLTANQYNIFAKSHGGKDGVAHVDFWLIYDNNIYSSCYGVYARSSASSGMYNCGYIDGWLIKNNSFVKNEYGIFAKAIPPYYEAHSSISSWKLSYNNLTEGRIGVLARGGIGQYGASAFCNNWNVYKNWFTSNNGTAVLLEQYADEWVISDNFITLNNEGIRICGSSANILQYNQMNNNRYNLGIEKSFDHDIDESNTINGRPVYYLINEENKSVPKDAGYVGLINCFNISIVGLNLSSNYQGIVIVNSINCSICCSTFFKNKYGIYMVSSSLTEIYHNNFIDNELHTFLQDSNVSRWDNGYPSGGNYWNDLTAPDWCRGKYQNKTGSDGIVDVSYKIDETNIDHYPLSAPWSSPIHIMLPGTRIYRGMNITGCARFQAINLTFTIDFNASWIGYSLDGQANVTIAGNITLMDLSYGWHNIIVYANDTSGNMWSSVKVHFAITFVTDVNYDQTVDIDDLVETTWRYGSIPGDPRWNVYADVNRDGIIDIEDVAMVAVDYGKTW